MVVERRDDRVFPSSLNPDLAHPNPGKRNMPRSTDWVGSDPEMKRKKRVAKYKMLSVEAKVKDTVRSSCRWIKTKFMEVRHGWEGFMWTHPCRECVKSAASPRIPRFTHSKPDDGSAYL